RVNPRTNLGVAIPYPSFEKRPHRYTSAGEPLGRHEGLTLLSKVGVPSDTAPQRVLYPRRAQVDSIAIRIGWTIFASLPGALAAAHGHPRGRHKPARCDDLSGYCLDVIDGERNHFCPLGRQRRLIILAELKVKQLTVCIAVRTYHPRSQ